MSPSRTRLITQGEYWNAPEIVSPYADLPPSLRWYEQYVMTAAVSSLGARQREVRRVYMVGCGSGREMPRLREIFPAARIIACDPAAAMVDLATRNLQAWGCTDRIEVRCCSASELRADGEPAQLVTLFDNVLTYVSPAAEREAMLGHLRALIETGGILIGAVHHRWGQLLKSAYFLAQPAARAFGLSVGEPGDRYGGAHGLRIPLHYFTGPELTDLLRNSGFAPSDIRSLAQLAPALDRKYRAWTGDNTLVFIATAI